MSRYLIYTAPRGGHLYTFIPTVEELRRRGHDVMVYAEERNLPLLRRLDIAGYPIDRAIEARGDDIWRARTPMGALRRSVQMYLDRAPHEARDVRGAVRAHRPDAVLVDSNCWGAAAALHGAGLPWAKAATLLLSFASPDAPPIGRTPRLPGSPMVTAREQLLRACLASMVDRLLPSINRLRRQLGAPAVRCGADLYTLAPLILSYTAYPIAYPQAFVPAHIRMVGPGNWDPAEHHSEPDWLGALERPAVLLVGSGRRRHHEKLVQTAVDALAGTALDVIVTTASMDPSRIRKPANARVHRYIPHSMILPRVAAVVCHGGIGVTQKALLAGVPVCVVPLHRHEHEIARRVDAAQAGVHISATGLSHRRFRAAVAQTIACKTGAQQAARLLAAAGGAPAAATALENLIRHDAIAHRPDEGAC